MLQQPSLERYKQMSTPSLEGYKNKPKYDEFIGLTYRAGVRDYIIGAWVTPMQPHH